MELGHAEVATDVEAAAARRPFQSGRACKAFRKRQLVSSWESFIIQLSITGLIGSANSECVER